MQAYVQSMIINGTVAGLMTDRQERRIEYFMNRIRRYVTRTNKRQPAESGRTMQDVRAELEVHGRATDGGRTGPTKYRTRVETAERDEGAAARWDAKRRWRSLTFPVRANDKVGGHRARGS